MSTPFSMGTTPWNFGTRFLCSMSPCQQMPSRKHVVDHADYAALTRRHGHASYISGTHLPCPADPLDTWSLVGIDCISQVRNIPKKERKRKYRFLDLNANEQHVMGRGRALYVLWHRIFFTLEVEWQRFRNIEWSNNAFCCVWSKERVAVLEGGDVGPDS